MAKQVKPAEISATATTTKVAEKVVISNVKIINDLKSLTTKFDEIRETIINIDNFLDKLRADLTLGIAVEEENMAKALKEKETKYQEEVLYIDENLLARKVAFAAAIKENDEKLAEAKKQFTRDLEKVAYDNAVITREETEKSLLAFAEKVKPEFTFVEKTKLTALTEASDKLSKEFQAEIGKAVGMAVAAKERDLNGTFLTEKNASAQSIALLTQQNATLSEQLKKLELQLVEKEAQIKMIPMQIADAVKNAAAPTNVYSGGGK